jgi:hypothetical protein
LYTFLCIFSFISLSFPAFFTPKPQSHLGLLNNALLDHWLTRSQLILQCYWIHITRSICSCQRKNSRRDTKKTYTGKWACSRRNMALRVPRPQAFIGICRNKSGKSWKTGLCVINFWSLGYASTSLTCWVGEVLVLNGYTGPIIFHCGRCRSARP